MIEGVILSTPNLVPDVDTHHIQKVVDGFSKVSSSKQIIKMNLDISEVSSDVHLGNLYEPLSIDQEACLGIQIQAKDLQHHGALAVQGEDRGNSSVKLVVSISLDEYC